MAKEHLNTNYEFKVDVEQHGAEVWYTSWMRTVGSTYWRKVGDSHHHETEHLAWSEIMDFVKDTLAVNRAHEIASAHKEVIRTFVEVANQIEENA